MGTRVASRRLYYGVGINDADYVAQPNNRQLRCPYFDVWHSMLRRCYSSSAVMCPPTVCPEWHKFTTFKSWMQEQPWQGKALDKDIKVSGSNLYSAETCTFVPTYINSFFTATRVAGYRNLPIGVNYKATLTTRPYIAQCFCEGRRRHIGIYSSAQEAHRAWQERKLEACSKVLIKYQQELVVDNGVVEALIACHKNIEADMVANKETFEINRPA